MYLLIVLHIKAMGTYCIICKKYSKPNSSVKRSRQNRLILVLNCVICGRKKSKFIKNQEVSELLIRAGIRAPLSNTPLIEGILF